MYKFHNYFIITSKKYKRFGDGKKDLEMEKKDLEMGKKIWMRKKIWTWEKRFGDEKKDWEMEKRLEHEKKIETLKKYISMIKILWWRCRTPSSSAIHLFFKKNN